MGEGFRKEILYRLRRKKLLKVIERARQKVLKKDQKEEEPGSVFTRS